jgi:hypothetical protein
MDKPKILILDIETAPGLAYFWSRFDKYAIPLERVLKPTRVICWAAKWLGERGIEFASEYDRGGSRRMFKRVHSLLSEADAVVTFNGDKFDLPRLNGAFVEYGLGPIPPLASIDIHKTARKLGLISSSLQFIAKLMKIGKKVEHAGLPLWIGWDNRQAAERAKMKEYNEGDVRLTEGVYKGLRPYITNHPRLYPKAKDKVLCGDCGSSDVQFRGNYHSKERSYRRFICKFCGRWGKVLYAKPK